MNNIEKTLWYFLFCEYLNPSKLKDINKEQEDKNRIVFETNFENLYSQIDKYKEEFIKLQNKAKKEYEKNKEEKTGADYELSIKIYGGFFYIGQISKQIEKVVGSHEKNDENSYTESPIDEEIAASYQIKLSTNLNQSDIFDVANFEQISKDNIFISNTPAVMKRFIQTKGLPNDTSKKLEKALEDLKSVVLGIRQEGELRDYLSQIDKMIMSEIRSELTEDMISDFFGNQKQIRVEIKFARKSEKMDFINSLLTSDIERVLRSGKYSKLLSDFLSTEFKGERIDLQDSKNDSFLRDTLSLPNFPYGAFASEYTLMFSQQFAVNQILKRFNERYGFYSVNGPPGTGKTTLLKDIIAALIVQRAEVLASLGADEILIESDKADKYGPLFYSLNPKLTGYEIVVASSNNGAVENISKEIPVEKSIDKKYLPKARELDFFTHTAKGLLGIGKAANSEEQEAWGLMCATLGKSTNIYNFNQKFTFDENTKLLQENDEIKALRLQKSEVWEKYRKVNKKCFNEWEKWKSSGKTDEQIKENAIKLTNSKDGLKIKAENLDKEIKKLQGTIATGYKKEFEKAKAEFKEAKNKYANLLQDFNQLVKFIENYPNTQQALQNKIYEYEQIDFASEFAKFDEAISGFDTKISDLNAEYSQVENSKNFISQTKPEKPFLFFIHQIFNTAAYKEYKRKDDEFSVKIYEIQNKSNEILQEKRALTNKKSEQENAKLNLKNKESELNSAKAKLENLNKNLEDSQNEIASKFGEIFKTDENEREKSSPFMKSDSGAKTELFKARVELFFKALKLHKMAILANASKFNTNFLKFAFLNKNMDLQRSEKVEIFKSLFFAVPVVSSTFAAFGRCFRDFECEDIGYLLVDEAGQAALSNAVGALWRSRHAVVVGDPLQLEPVVTLPANLNKTLLDSFGIDDSLNLATASVQGRADFHEKFGTYINGLWVGSPLRVHNRCDDPMFKIANKIAYEKLMIWGRNKNKGTNPNLKSVWVNVKSTNFVENFSEEEGRKALEIVEKILKAGKVDPDNQDDKNITQDDIKIISPFRGVVKAMKAIAPKELKDNIGTIHTMQGKEAKVIIFILGGASGGARVWAASKPNLLNVALTRAKNYIYIIGNRDNWKDLEYFKDAADKLEIRIIN